MRNKLKRSKKYKDAWCQSKDRPEQTVQMITDSCSNDETSPGRDSASLTAEDAAADISTRTPPPPQEQRKTFCAKDIKIAPIFLHTTRQRKSKRSSDGRLDEPVEKLQESETEDVQLVINQQLLSSVSQQTERKRVQLSPSVLHICLKEIQTSNPAFPLQTVFSSLQRKASERLQDFGSTEKLNFTQNHIKEKRKRGNESSEREPKRLRSSPLTAETGMGHCCMSAQDVQERNVLTVQKQHRSNKLSRTHRLKQQSGSPAVLVMKHCHSQSLKSSNIVQRDSSFEDVLWTDKYSPQHSSEVIGNSASVNKLQSWLKKWKLRADCDERRKMEERKQEENSNNSWDCGDFQGEPGLEDDREEPLCNTMLITGPPGMGKTAAVYACAQELGFKVFEVNCSSQRSGCHVLSQLKEATQSHQVEVSGKDPLKPTYFNNYNSCTPKSETLPGKTVRPKNVSFTSKKRAAQKFGRSSHKGKTNPATVTLTNYFKMKAKADRLHFSGVSPAEKPDSEESCNPSPGSDQTTPRNKKTATSLILFEEVDVIFDDDVGFLAAIKTFMTTTKRPVVLTTNDPSFRERFSCSLEEIIFKTPSVVNVCSYLQLVGLTENVRLESEDVCSLLRLSRGDIRRCLLQLQLWVHSGGGRASRSGDSPEESTHVQRWSVTDSGDDADSQLPHCDSGCTASMLGLHPVTQHQLFNLLKCQFWSETHMNQLLRLLAESWRGGVPLLYSNLELLLPFGAEGTYSGLRRELVSSDTDLHNRQLDRYVSGKTSATCSESARNISRLSRRNYITALSDTTTSSSITQNPQRSSSLSKRAHLRDKTEEKAAKVETYCLEALTDFFDLMSYLDATMPSAAAPHVTGSCCPDAFVWTGAEIKDGLLDEMSEDEEVGRIQSQERLLDIQAAVEGFGCHRCCWRVSEAWTEAQNNRKELGDTKRGRLTLAASSKRQSFSFSFQPLCAPSLSKRRYELSRMVLCCKSFGLLGNRRAVSVDYLPFLRYICRLQREQDEREEPIRCLNYLSSKHLGLSKTTVKLLAEDFS